MNRDSVGAEVDIELGNSLHYRTTLATPTEDGARTYELFTTFLRDAMAITPWLRGESIPACVRADALAGVPRPRRMPGLPEKWPC